jgi:hypothetical protein
VRKVVIPTIIFDTSGINALENGGAASEPLMRRLQCGFKVILTFTSAEELIATPELEKREALLARFERLWRLGAECICPPHEIMRLLIYAHSSDPSQFDWTKVGVRTPECRDLEYAIARRDLDNELCIQQRTENLESEKGFQGIWKGLRPKVDPIFMEEPFRRPNNYGEAVATGAAEYWGQKHYKSFSGSELTETEVQSFMEVCPPFRAYCYGTVMAEYNWALRAYDGNKRPSAGRNDLYAAVYLPYCDQFITNDRPQRENLREVASGAKIPCEILCLNDFEHSGVSRVGTANP